VTIKKFIIGYFVVMGVLFSLVLLVLLYVYVADPFQIRPLLDSLMKTQVVAPTESAKVTRESEEVDRDDVTSQSVSTEIDAVTTSESEPLPQPSLLTPAQEDALRLVGINPDVLPATITPEQESCFVQKLGTERVAAIKGGETPTVVEILVAKDCL
jgi:hypothetical protein